MSIVLKRGEAIWSHMTYAVGQDTARCICWCWVHIWMHHRDSHTPLSNDNCIRQLHSLLGSRSISASNWIELFHIWTRREPLDYLKFCTLQQNIIIHIAFNLNIWITPYNKDSTGQVCRQKLTTRLLCNPRQIFQAFPVIKLGTYLSTPYYTSIWLDCPISTKGLAQAPLISCHLVCVYNNPIYQQGLLHNSTPGALSSVPQWHGPNFLQPLHHRLHISQLFAHHPVRATEHREECHKMHMGKMKPQGRSGVHLLATLPRCTVDAMITWWTCVTTVALSTLTGKFCIHAIIVVIFPASSTRAGAFYPPHQCHVHEGCQNKQCDL